MKFNRQTWYRPSLMWCILIGVFIGGKNDQQQHHLQSSSNFVSSASLLPSLLSTNAFFLVRTNSSNIEAPSPYFVFGVTEFDVLGEFIRGNPSDGCEKMNNASGRIVWIEPYHCSIETKIRNCALAGCVAAVSSSAYRIPGNEMWTQWDDSSSLVNLATDIKKLKPGESSSNSDSDPQVPPIPFVHVGRDDADLIRIALKDREDYLRKLLELEKTHPNSTAALNSVITGTKGIGTSTIGTSVDGSTSTISSSPAHSVVPALPSSSTTLNISAIPEDELINFHVFLSSGDSPNPWSDAFQSVYFTIFFQVMLGCLHIIVFLAAVAKFKRYYLLRESRPFYAKIPLTCLMFLILSNLERGLYCFLDPMGATHVVPRGWRRVLLSISVPWTYASTLLLTFFWSEALEQSRPMKERKDEVTAVMELEAANIKKGRSKSMDDSESNQIGNHAIVPAGGRVRKDSLEMIELNLAASGHHLRPNNLQHGVHQTHPQAGVINPRVGGHNHSPLKTHRGMTHHPHHHHHHHRPTQHHQRSRVSKHRHHSKFLSIGQADQYNEPLKLHHDDDEDEQMELYVDEEQRQQTDIYVDEDETQQNYQQPQLHHTHRVQHQHQRRISSPQLQQQLLAQQQHRQDNLASDSAVPPNEDLRGSPVRFIQTHMSTPLRITLPTTLPPPPPPSPPVIPAPMSEAFLPKAIDVPVTPAHKHSPSPSSVSGHKSSRFSHLKSEPLYAHLSNGDEKVKKINAPVVTHTPVAAPINSAKAYHFIPIAASDKSSSVRTAPTTPKVASPKPSAAKKSSSSKKEAPLGSHHQFLVKYRVPFILATVFLVLLDMIFSVLDSMYILDWQLLPVVEIVFAMIGIMITAMYFWVAYRVVKRFKQEADWKVRTAEYNAQQETHDCVDGLACSGPSNVDLAGLDKSRPISPHGAAGEHKSTEPNDDGARRTPLPQPYDTLDGTGTTVGATMNYPVTPVGFSSILQLPHSTMNDKSHQPPASTPLAVSRHVSALIDDIHRSHRDRIVRMTQFTLGSGLGLLLFLCVSLASPQLWHTQLRTTLDDPITTISRDFLMFLALFIVGACQVCAF